MRMIDKKERENLEAYLQKIGAEEIGLLELIDLKGRDALDKAAEISQAIAKIEDKSASDVDIKPTQSVLQRFS